MERMEEYIRFINKTQDYINAHLDKKITLEDVAKNVHLSKFHFHRIFSKHSKETLNQFIVRTKMERAALFLTVRRDITMTEIAQRYGYSDASSFNRAFKKHFHMPPSSYKRARMAND